MGDELEATWLSWRTTPSWVARSQPYQALRLGQASGRSLPPSLLGGTSESSQAALSLMTGHSAPVTAGQRSSSRGSTAADVSWPQTAPPCCRSRPAWGGMKSHHVPFTSLLQEGHGDSQRVNGEGSTGGPARRHPLALLPGILLP